MLSHWFSRRQRIDIFDFHDGFRHRAVDPLEMWAKLDRAVGRDWTDLLDLIASPPVPGLTGELERDWERERHRAATKLSEAVTEVFAVPRFRSGRGLTVTDRIALAASFLDYMGGLADQARPFSPSSEESPAPSAASPLRSASASSS